MQKARRHFTGKLRRVVGARFQVLFTRLLGVLFTFPSRYWFTIGHERVFSLAGWCRPLQTGCLRSRLTQDPLRPAAPLATTGLSPSAAASFQRLRLRCAGAMRRVLLPRRGLDPKAVWACARSLAATSAITVVFSSSGYLDVSVPRVSAPVAEGGAASRRRVAPFGNLRIRACLQLPAAYRSLPRPSSPAHA